eukprot:SAG22_NODE_10543_length_528_cov_5.167832_1_plen_42_part_01
MRLTHYSKIFWEFYGEFGPFPGIFPDPIRALSAPKIAALAQS